MGKWGRRNDKGNGEMGEESRDQVLLGDYVGIARVRCRHCG